jgi:hypothetical protein
MAVSALTNLIVARLAPDPAAEAHGPEPVVSVIVRNWVTKYISPDDPVITQNGFGGTNPWGG